ncbi:allantoinase AllB [Spiractinospora alimapuensis]|uniref:allantoinase AllB n=1 Tax=Spiractinospora alimapuensis TaxID=2820884 RepID=UPI001F1F3343|nr:allantoinase AllB [Spiractinospora alimapuensis]QVQ51817.1 allantoinase AllB [Spiractinospora alimapuensis]
MIECDLVIHAPRAVTPAGERSVSVGVRDGMIVSLEEGGSTARTGRVVQLDRDQVLLPGLVDTHVHVNEPGRTEWEGFASATRSAAAGGVTTIVDMPLNSVPPTTSVAALATKRAAARGRVAVDVGFWGGAVPENAGPYAPADGLPGLTNAGVFGFKCFLSPSGVPEFGHLSAEEFAHAAKTVGDLGGTMIVHAEDPTVLESAPTARGRDYASFLASRPDTAEHSAIELVIETARRTGTDCHILHLSSASALPLIARAKAEGVPLTVETCPHYLTLTAEEIPAGGTEFKCCPPIRDGANRDALWAALSDGLIDCVVSDHSPSTPDLKHRETGDFGTAWGGIAGLQVGLPAVWTEARRRGHPLTDVVRWMATRPAQIAGLRGKGQLTVGHSADFVVFAPLSTLHVDAHALHHRNPVTAYDGRELTGKVVQTWLRGEEVILDDPRGHLLSR